MWETKKLGDVCETGAGGTPLKSKKEYYDSGTIPWLLSGEVSQRDIRRAKCFISDAGLKNSSAKLFPVNTVLVAMYGATAGQVGILRFEACTNQAVCGILPNQQTIPEFIYYTFLLKKNELVATASGNAQPNISQTKIKNTLIPLPPLPEQRRIVGILDEAFAGIDKIIANTEQNLSNARELFESYLNNAFTQKADGWVEKKLGDVINLEYGKALPREERSDSGSYPVYGANGIKSYSDRFYHGKQSIIVGRKGSAGEINLTEGRFWPLDVTYFVTFDEHKYDLTFLFHCLSSLQLTRLAKGVKPGINRNDVYELEFSFPPLSEQRRIAAALDRISAETRRLEAIYKQKLDALNELKQSILHKAFRGELVNGDLPGSAPADTT